MFCPYFGKIFCAAGKFLKKKQSKKAFLGTFWKILTKKLRFFGARSPSKLVNIGAKGAFRKMLMVGRPKVDFLKSTKGGTLWVGRVSNPWGRGGGGGAFALPPLNPPLLIIHSISFFSCLKMWYSDKSQQKTTRKNSEKRQLESLKFLV